MLHIIPKHIGIILDGNRRFARTLMKRPWEGHKWGLRKARDVLQWSCNHGIKYITAYVLSLENIKSRPKRELSYILKMLEKEADSILEHKDHVIHQLKVQVRVIGRVNQLPLKLQKKLREVEDITKKYTKHYLNIAVAYGGQQEIVDATKKIVKKCLKGIIKPSQVNEKLMQENLSTNGQPSPDLILRTGGEKRLSNFLTYQSVYSELIFTDKKWPEMTEKDFENALNEFENRQRRFGS